MSAISAPILINHGQFVFLGEFLSDIKFCYRLELINRNPEKFVPCMFQAWCICRIAWDHPQKIVDSAQGSWNEPINVHLLVSALGSVKLEKSLDRSRAPNPAHIHWNGLNSQIDECTYHMLRRAFVNKKLTICIKSGASFIQKALHAKRFTSPVFSPLCQPTPVKVPILFLEL